MNSLGKYVLTKTQKIVLLVVVFALIAGGYYAGFYLPVQRRIEAADTAELDAQIRRWFRPTIISRRRRRS